MNDYRGDKMMLLNPGHRSECSIDTPPTSSDDATAPPPRQPARLVLMQLFKEMYDCSPQSLRPREAHLLVSKSPISRSARSWLRSSAAFVASRPTTFFCTRT